MATRVGLPCSFVEHRGVARVLALAAVALVHVPRQPQTPDGHDDEQRQPSPAGAVTDDGGHGRDDDEAESPRGVDDADPALAVPLDGRRGHQQDDGEQREPSDRKEVRAVEHHGPARRTHRLEVGPPPWSGRTARIWSTPIRPSRKAIAPPTR